MERRTHLAILGIWGSKPKKKRKREDGRDDAGSDVASWRFL
jgi:hypothetical protein